MNKLKDIFKNFYQKDFTRDDFDVLLKASENGNLDVIEKLFLSKKIKSTDNYNLEAVFNKACINGHLHVVKYFLNSENTKNIFDRIHIKNDSWIKNTCENGNLNIIKYLFCSDELKFHPNIHVRDDEAFVAACNGLNFELIKFLAASKELKEHSNIHAQNDYAFISICNDYYRASTFNKRTYMKYAFMRDNYGNKANNLANPALIMEIIKYFIYDLNIEKNNNIIDYLNSFSKEDKAVDLQRTINAMFDNRDLHNSLVSELVTNKEKPTHKRLKL